MSPPTSRAPERAKTPSIKGLVFREFVRWYEETRGREATMRAYASLGEHLRTHLDPDRDCFGILAGSWYPVDIVGGMLESITWGLTLEQRSALLRSGVNHSVGVTLTGVYKVLFKTLVTPERHAKYAQKIWDNYYNTGTVRGRMLAENRSEQWVIDWSGHHPLLCELSIWSLTVFHEHMGCTNVKVSRSACVLDSQPSLRGPRRSSSTNMKAVDPVKPTEPRIEPEERPDGCRFLIQWQMR